MSVLLRQVVRSIGGSVLQRAKAAGRSPAVAEERSRLVPRRTYSMEKGGGEERLSKWDERRLQFKQFDHQFTKVLNGVLVVYCVYAILSVGDNPPWPIRKYVADYEREEAVMTDEKIQDE